MKIFLPYSALSDLESQSQINLIKREFLDDLGMIDLRKKKKLDLMNVWQNDMSLVYLDNIKLNDRKKKKKQLLQRVQTSKLTTYISPHK